MTTNSYGSLKKRPIHPNMSVEEIAYLTTNNIPHKLVEELVPELRLLAVESLPMLVMLFKLLVLVQ